MENVNLLEKYKAKTQLSQIVDLATKTQKCFLPWVDALAWFREEHPNGRIETKILASSADGNYAKVATTIFAEPTDVTPLVIYEEEAWSSSADERPQAASSKAKFWSMAQALLIAGYGCQFGGVVAIETDNVSAADLTRRELPPIPFEEPVIPAIQEQGVEEPEMTEEEKAEPEQIDEKASLSAAWATIWPFGDNKGKTLMMLNKEGALKSSIEWLLSSKGAAYRIKYPDVEKACQYLKSVSKKTA